MAGGDTHRPPGERSLRWGDLLCARGHHTMSVRVLSAELRLRVTSGPPPPPTPESTNTRRVAAVYWSRRKAQHAWHRQILKMFDDTATEEPVVLRPRKALSSASDAK